MIGSSGGCGNVLQGAQATLLGSVEFTLHLLDVEQLTSQMLTALGDLFQEVVELLAIAAGRVVEVDQLLAFGQREADTLATQDQHQRDPIPGAVDAFLAAPLWREHALFFIETNGAGGDAQLAGQIRNAVGNAHGGQLTDDYLYVNVSLQLQDCQINR